MLFRSVTDSASDTPFPAVEKLNDAQTEALDMIFHKIGRILAGDPNFRDHWQDIADNIARRPWKKQAARRVLEHLGAIDGQDR